MVGSNASIVQNRKAIRMANLSAAEMIKAELSNVSAGGAGDDDQAAVKKNLSAAELLKKELAGEGGEEEAVGDDVKMVDEGTAAALDDEMEVAVAVDTVTGDAAGIAAVPGVVTETIEAPRVDAAMEETSPRGLKRKVEEVEEPAADGAKAEDDEDDDDEDDDAVDAFLAASLLAPTTAQKPAPLKLMGNNVAEQEDTVM